MNPAGTPPEGGCAAVQKKIPMRQCLGCREMKPKRELLRVVRSPEGEGAFDARGKLPGRGAYVCPNPDCFKKAVKTRALDRALEVKIPEEVMERLAGQLEVTQDGQGSYLSRPDAEGREDRTWRDRHGRGGESRTRAAAAPGGGRLGARAKACRGLSVRPPGAAGAAAVFKGGA